MKTASPSSASIDRRHFLAVSGLLPAALAAGASGLTTRAADASSTEVRTKRPIGLEL